jgi:putative transcriptional regulator
MKDLFSRNIKFLRLVNNKSQSDIGLQLNKAHTSIGNWEKGISEPSLEEIEEIARIFEISAKDLLFTDLSNVEVNDEANVEVTAAKAKFTEVAKEVKAICKVCIAKDEVIKSKDEVIDTQKGLIESLQLSQKLLQQQLEVIIPHSKRTG